MKVRVSGRSCRKLEKQGEPSGERAQPMIKDPVVLLQNLVLSLSDALDLVHLVAVDHQLRVAYIALRLTLPAGRSPEEQTDLLYAAALHDIGLLSVEEKVDMMQGEVEDLDRHVRFGADLLFRFDLFRTSSEIVRYHHKPWGAADGWEGVPETVRFSANAVHLADTVERMIRRDAGILSQAPRIAAAVTGMKEDRFSPDLVDAFQDLAMVESFWFDAVSPHISAIITGMVEWPRVTLRMDGLEQIGQILSRIVDFRSSYTASHSSGVAASAELLARRLYFEERECRLLRIAGHLHDLGKVAVPNAILEKAGRLSSSEFDAIRGHAYHTYHILANIGGFEEITQWASFHHERMDGKGYPFHHIGEALPLGSRIMAVADVFAALTENRPYRDGVGREETIGILRGFASKGALDPRIVSVLIDEFDPIRRGRVEAQEAHIEEFSRRDTVRGKDPRLT
jgi:HD-GYP domain-containing protein (c-di-GMP phosphodiesterase class II)